LTAKSLKRNLGFTLVELLIVIGLLGAIALIVIAAINPIEQANRARDTRFKADGAQLISAIDRYFAARLSFPWVPGSALNNDAPYGYESATDWGVGICDEPLPAGGGCDADGFLLDTDELKSEFRNRDFISTEVAADMLYIGKASDTSSSVYACFVPASKATREKACEEDKVWILSTDGSGGRAAVSQTDCTDAEGTSWTSNLWTVCVPE
jgi:prepilin-type N-terminal cleavage/methylation domain-containing protein